MVKSEVKTMWFDSNNKVDYVQVSGNLGKLEHKATKLELGARVVLAGTRHGVIVAVVKSDFFKVRLDKNNVVMEAKAVYLTLEA